MKTTTLPTSIIKIILVSTCIGYGFNVKAIAIIKEKTNKILVKEDPKAAINTIIKFLQWYKVNLHKTNNFSILKKDSKGNFMIDKLACTAYLNFLKSRNCLSEKYIHYWQTFFDEKADDLKKNHVQSDIPEGFDEDFVLITQEPDLVLQQINRMKFKTISINRSAALINVKLTGGGAIEYEIEMYKEKNG